MIQAQASKRSDTGSIKGTKTTKNLQQIASIVLNYNSDADVQVLVPQLLAQTSVNHAVIIVDNASSHVCVQRLQVWLHAWQPDALVGTPEAIERQIREAPGQAQGSGRVYLVLNPENRGYSAGNNIGLRLADTLGASAVLIANPDMRIVDSHYLAGLTDTLFSSPKNCIAASRILGLDGKDQNPQRESTYFEELFWPYLKIKYRLFKKNLVVIPKKHQVEVVKKVSGCCLLLKMHFLKKCDYLDENIFLYCEEPILSARVRQMNGAIVFDPSKVAIHAHDSTQKGNSAKAALVFIKSRKYYIEKYSGYGLAQKQLLSISYATMALYYKVKLLLKA